MRHAAFTCHDTCTPEGPAALDELRCTPPAGTGVDQCGIGTGRAGTAANISIQIRYCTATFADKPFGEMPNLIR